MKRIILLFVAAAALALALVPVVSAWHAESVSVSAECRDNTYYVSASIQGSSDPGEYVISVTPASFPGDTHGTQSITVVIGWTQSEETQTFYETVYLKGDCKVPTPPPPPPPPCPNNPGGQPPNPPGGKDGNPGHDECVEDTPAPPLVIEPTPPVETTTPPPVTETTPTTPPAEETVTPPIVSKNPPHITAPPKPPKQAKPPKMPPVCPPAAPFEGKCAVPGQG